VLGDVLLVPSIALGESRRSLVCSCVKFIHTCPLMTDSPWK